MSSKITLLHILSIKEKLKKSLIARGVVNPAKHEGLSHFLRE